MTAQGSGAGIQPPGARITSIGTVYSGGTRLYGSHSATDTATAGIVAGTSYFYKYWWPYGWVPSLIGLEVATAVALAKLKLALYQLNVDDSIGTQIGTVADLDASTTGIKTGAITPGNLWYGPGFYAFGACADQAITPRWHGSCVSGWPYRAGTVGPLAQLLVATTYAGGVPSTAPAMNTLTVSSAAHLFGLLGAP